jgi:hypothetical protein
MFIMKSCDFCGSYNNNCPDWEQAPAPCPNWSPLPPLPNEEDLDWDSCFSESLEKYRTR